MLKPKFSYDPECEKMARQFLDDDSDIAKAEIDLDAPKLAQAIQNTIEGFLSHTRSEVDAP